MEMPNEIREAWETMLSYLEEGRAVVVASDSHGLPTLHNFYKQDPEKVEQYRSTIKHQGFGYFYGETENGKFEFNGGGAMMYAKAEDGTYLSWSPVDCSPEVLKDLDYDMEKVKEIIRAKLA